MIHTILFNGNIITLDEKRPRGRALAISYGKVVALGADDEIPAIGKFEDVHGQSGREDGSARADRCAPTLGGAVTGAAIGQCV